MTNRRSELQEDKFFRILQILEKHPHVTQREIAFMLGLSTSGINYCLKALVNKGWIKIQNFKNSESKLNYAYLLTPTGFSEKVILTRSFLKRKMKEYDNLRSEIDEMRKTFSLNDENYQNFEKK
jgi:EPS-associated MarR family transcriptional regulator